MSEEEHKKDTDFFLVGKPEQAIPESKLPTVRSVLKLFFYVKRRTPDNSTAFRSVVDSVLCVWSMTRIPTMLPRNCVRKLKKLYEEWQALAKNEKRKSDPGGRRAKFIASLDQLWDVGATDAIEQIRGNQRLTQDERDIDIRFYLDQCSERRGYMSENQKVLPPTIRRRERKRERKRTIVSRADVPPEPAALASSSGTGSLAVASDADQFLDPAPAKRTRLGSAVTPIIPRRIRKPKATIPIPDVATRPAQQEVG
ncbi:uncharacterized protein LOC122386201 [Amphibalanus amphitrite]|uniref:uncharacterized protein LOC122366246 n=1 Tax=Amphibalanus amphitrite TaxID=1232801 RepID=UPI001C921F50|nr:uncharacterized protein LOC122366246 [Amphibalanus amphitrite]XP_043231099.1 uncharacterized protein LOC122386201 [Amphibalanus amphitrite]